MSFPPNTCRRCRRWQVFLLYFGLVVAGSVFVGCATPVERLEGEPEVLAGILRPLKPYLDRQDKALVYPEALNAISAIEGLRPRLNAYYESRNYECYDRFFVQFCLTLLLRSQQYWTEKVRMVEIPARAVRRRHLVFEEQMKIQSRQANSPESSPTSDSEAELQRLIK